MLHYVFCYALVPALFNSAKAIAGESTQQVEPVSSELCCDGLRQQPKRAEKVPARVVDDRRIRIGQIHIRTKPIFAEDADAIWLHHFANWLHVTAHTDTVAHELPFTGAQEIQLSDWAEAQRLLRSLLNAQCEFPVLVWDSHFRWMTALMSTG